MASVRDAVLMVIPPSDGMKSTRLTSNCSGSGGGGKLDSVRHAVQRGAIVTNSRDFIAHVLEMMRPAGAPTARPMFGGHGVYLDGVIVGIVDDDVLYLKTDAQSRARFEAQDLPAFRYRGHDGELHATGYFRAPDGALESPPEMREWLRVAWAAALRAKAAKAPRRAAPATKTPRETSATKGRAKRR